MRLGIKALPSGAWSVSVCGLYSIELKVAIFARWGLVDIGMEILPDKASLTLV